MSAYLTEHKVFERLTSLQQYMEIAPTTDAEMADLHRRMNGIDHDMTRAMLTGATLQAFQFDLLSLWVDCCVVFTISDCLLRRFSLILSRFTSLWDDCCLVSLLGVPLPAFYLDFSNYSSLLFECCSVWHFELPFSAIQLDLLHLLFVRMGIGLVYDNLDVEL